MKTNRFVKGLLLLPFLITTTLAAQRSISIDLGAIRQRNHHNGGVNISSFYHVNEHLLVGLELNRFFPVRRIIDDEELRLSGWDIEMNIHYRLPLLKSWQVYPITGISHTSEKELNEITRQSRYENFWSVNTGAGMLLELGKWRPYVEYNFSWGRLNQQFVLLGIGYEIEWGKDKE